ncbi:Neutrophil gelatinase-associated lipocalin, partial [Galemys pyrenaicus]
APPRPSRCLPAAPAVETMPRGLLWLGLCLLAALRTQAQDATLAANRVPAPPLLRVPLQPDFQGDQGKWYVLGLAGNNFRREDQGRVKMYATIYQLQEDESYNVTSILLRGQRCDYWVRSFVPSFQPGQFNLGNISQYPDLRSYTVRVASTDYTQFAMVFFKKRDRRREHFKTTLYGGSSSPTSEVQLLATLGLGRTKELTPELKERFIRFAKSLGLTDDHIVFPVPIGKARGRGGGTWGP